jgi:DnaJ-class molecular chaperone
MVKRSDLNAAKSYFKIPHLSKLTNAKLRRLFKKKAVLLHPDKNLDDPEANANFVALSKHHQVLVEFLESSSYQSQQQGGVFVVPYSTETVTLPLKTVFCGEMVELSLSQNLKCTACDKPCYFAPCEDCNETGVVWTQFCSAESRAICCTSCKGTKIQRISLCEQCGGEGFIKKQVRYQFKTNRKMIPGMVIPLHAIRVNLFIQLSNYGDFSVSPDPKSQDLHYRSVILTSEQAYRRPFMFEITHLDGRLLKLATLDPLSNGDVFTVQNEGLEPAGKLLVHFVVKQELPPQSIPRIPGITYISKHNSGEGQYGTAQSLFDDTPSSCTQQ